MDSLCTFYGASGTPYEYLRIGLVSLPTSGTYLFVRQSGDQVEIKHAYEAADISGILPKMPYWEAVTNGEFVVYVHVNANGRAARRRELKDIQEKHLTRMN